MTTHPQLRKEVASGESRVVLGDNRTARTRIDPWSARLADPDLEARFLHDRRDHDLGRIRVAAILGSAVSLIFAVLDWLVITENLHLALALRILTALPGAGTIFVLTYAGYFQARPQLLISLAIVVSTASYATLNIICDTPGEYLSGFVIVQMFLYFIFPVAFTVSVALGCICVSAFAILIILIRDIALGELLTIYSQYAVTGLAGSFAVYIFNTLRREEFLNELEIESQNQRYGELLNRILPDSIVARMERGEDRIADEVPDAVVVFADVVGFTETAARHSPEAVVRSLNALFEKFDTLVASNGLEKIKTIGDAYMVAGGVPDPRKGNIEAAAELALQMLEAAGSHRGPGGERVEIRVGIHAGPVLAGVIGHTRFGYDLWGDTVNFASRLQDAAEPLSVLVSEAVRHRLPENFVLHPLGSIALKGKGEMPVWQLCGKARQAADPE